MTIKHNLFGTRAARLIDLATKSGISGKLLIPGAHGIMQTVSYKNQLQFK
jgi:hypothetical protein